MNRLTFVLAALGAGLALLLFNSNTGKVFGIENDNFAQLVMFGTIATVMASGVIGNRHRIGPALKMMLVWLVIILAVASAYVYRSEILSIGDRVAGGLIPGRLSVENGTDGKAIVRLSKSRNGHFAANVVVNGHPVAMMFDTGASDVALTFEDAVALGLDPNQLDFTRPVQTANGATFYAPVTLQSVSLGPLIRNNIHASVAMRGSLNQSLLGMSFLSTLGSLEISNDTITLRD